MRLAAHGFGLAGVSFMLVDLGDQLPLPDDLCVALGVPLGSVEPNQCVLLHTALAWLGWRAGPSELMGIPPKSQIIQAAVALRRRADAARRAHVRGLVL